ncbi:MAG: metal-dependent transcriptional regulator [Deltaproteobacteria bacterium]|nr:metal-dependent transcriptional regulator [Deltaproteobacteria bacterium]
MKSKNLQISPAMEDYLETIYLLVGERKVARVKDIAAARGVKPGSVSPAMKKLAAMGLIRYEQREFIDLTPEGEEVARRTLARHELLRRFFHDVLNVSQKNARSDACAMEHYLSDEGVDRLTKFFEFIQRCPRGSKTEFLDRLHHCPLVNPGQPDCDHDCPEVAAMSRTPAVRRSLSDLQPGESGTVAQVDAAGQVRRRLIDRGLIPQTTVEVVRNLPRGSVRILVNGQETSLTTQEATHVVLAP